MSAHDEPVTGDPVDAAGWRVALDAAPHDAALGARFGAWLDLSPAHERAMERVELAIELGRRLAMDPDITAVAARPPRRRWAMLGLAAAVIADGIALTLLSASTQTTSTFPIRTPVFAANAAGPSLLD